MLNSKILQSPSWEFDYHNVGINNLVKLGGRGFARVSSVLVPALTGGKAKVVGKVETV